LFVRRGFGDSRKEHSARSASGGGKYIQKRLQGESFWLRAGAGLAAAGASQLVVRKRWGLIARSGASGCAQALGQKRTSPHFRRFP